jgi:hypothetical protein
MNMFKKKVFMHSPESHHIISKVPENGFKKGESVQVPQGYEALLFEADGGQELIKNQLLIKLENPIQYVYFAKSNRRIIRSNWGTPNRIKVNTEVGLKSFGGFGFVEFQLINPLRFVATRMSNETFVDEAIITQIVLGRIPEAMHQVLPGLEPLSTENESVIINQLVESLKPVLNKALDNIGIRLETLVIENINFQAIEEGQ